MPADKANKEQGKFLNENRQKYARILPHKDSG